MAREAKGGQSFKVKPVVTDNGHEVSGRRWTLLVCEVKVGSSTHRKNAAFFLRKLGLMAQTVQVIAKSYLEVWEVWGDADCLWRFSQMDFVKDGHFAVTSTVGRTPMGSGELNARHVKQMRDDSSRRCRKVAHYVRPLACVHLSTGKVVKVA